MRSPDDCKVCVDYSEDVVCRHCYEAALGALRTVAQRQRESCAAQARFYAGMNASADVMENKVRATPLVTEVEP